MTLGLRPLVLSFLLALAAGCPVEYVVPLDRETHDGMDDSSPSGTGADDDERCDPPLLDCGGVCIDPDDDPDHCGECGEDCGPGGSCVNGDCIDACGDTCDRHREVCLNGTCVCRLGFERCGDVCVDLGTNPAYCGGCNETCLDDDDDVNLCEEGDCSDDGCSDGLTQCGQSCVDLQTHPLHCEECGRACDGDEVCIDGDCEDL